LHVIWSDNYPVLRGDEVGGIVRRGRMSVEITESTEITDITWRDER